MTIENADYIHQLITENPKPVDPISEGDNHIRLIKKLLTESFPSDLDGMIVPNITDNSDKYLRVNPDGDAIEWHQIQVQGAGAIPFRSALSYKDGNTIILGPGEYAHKDQSGTLYWTEDKELTINNPLGKFAYIYLNNSGTVTPSWSDNSPTWSNTDRGWYLDDKRCIGAVPIQGNQVYHFYHDGGEYFNYGGDITEPASGLAVVNEWTNIYLDGVPSFATQCQCTWACHSFGGQTDSVIWSYRTQGVTNSGHWFAITEAGEGAYEDARSVSNIRMTVSKPFNGVQYFADVKSDGADFNLWTNGFYLPRGI